MVPVIGELEPAGLLLFRISICLLACFLLRCCFSEGNISITLRHMDHKWLELSGFLHMAPVGLAPGPYNKLSRWAGGGGWLLFVFFFFFFKLSRSPPPFFFFNFIFNLFFTLHIPFPASPSTLCLLHIPHLLPTPPQLLVDAHLASINSLGPPVS